MMAARAQKMNELIVAGKPLYAALTPEQKQIADGLLTPGHERGGHGGESGLVVGSVTRVAGDETRADGPGDRREPLGAAPTDDQRRGVDRGAEAVREAGEIADSCADGKGE